MPKLLQINECLNFSTGNIAQGCVEAATAKGWDCYFAYSSREPLVQSKAQVIKVGSKLTPYIHYAENYLFDREGLSSRLATKQLVNKIRHIEPDVVHLHNLHDHWLNYKILFDYLNTTNIKVVWTLHDFWPITGHCMHFVSKQCTRFQNGCHDCPMQKEYPYSLIDRSAKNWFLKKKLFTANRNLTIVPVSQWVGDVVKSSFLRSNSIHVINNGVDVSIFKPTAMDILPCISDDVRNCLSSSGQKFVIMAVASEWKNGKGLEDFLSMSKMISEDEIIVLVGLNDEIICSLPPTVVGIKRTSNIQELAALYTRADVVCSFSEAETFGLTITEGYACGTPAVVYNNTAPPSLITPSTGFVVSDKNFREAYKAILHIKNKGKSFYSNSCIGLAHSKYNKNKCFEEYVNLYEQLLNEY